MKKVLLLLVCLFTLQTVVWADDDKPIQVNQLPQTAQTFIKTHFPNNKVAMAKMETDWFDKSYDVIFTNGHELLYHDDNGDKGTKGDDPLADAVHLDGLVCTNHIVDHFHRLTSWLLISGLRSAL